MNYKTPVEPESYLGEYTDGESISESLKNMVALSTREGLVIPMKNGSFSGGTTMTRGNAAVVLYNLFQKIW